MKEAEYLIGKVINKDKSCSMVKEIGKKGDSETENGPSGDNLKTLEQFH